MPPGSASQADLQIAAEDITTLQQTLSTMAKKLEDNRLLMASQHATLSGLLPTKNRDAALTAVARLGAECRAAEIDVSAQSSNLTLSAVAVISTMRPYRQQRAAPMSTGVE